MVCWGIGGGGGGGGGVSLKTFPVSIKFNYKIWLFPPKPSLFDKKKSENKLIAIYGRLKAEDLKRNSWVSKNLILATFMSKLTLQLSEVLLHFIKDNTPFNFTYYMIVYKNCMRC